MPVCPLTPDHSFFTTVLSTIDTTQRGHAAARRLGEAIKVALRGFPAGAGAKLIVLITDGDDQDRYSEEAAQAARDAGVKIVAVGLGSEDGSQITLTDPQTGAKTTLMHDGKPVISKLDGEPAAQDRADHRGRVRARRHLARSISTRSWRATSQPIVRAAADAVDARDPRRAVSSGSCSRARVPARRAVGRRRGRRPEVLVIRVLVIIVPAARELRRRAPRGARQLQRGRRGARARATTRRPRRLLLDARSQAGVDPELRFRAAYDLGVAYAAHAEKIKTGDKPDLAKALELAQQARVVVRRRGAAAQGRRGHRRRTSRSCARACRRSPTSCARARASSRPGSTR